MSTKQEATKWVVKTLAAGMARKMVRDMVRDDRTLEQRYSYLSLFWGRGISGLLTDATEEYMEKLVEEGFTKWSERKTSANN